MIKEKFSGAWLAKRAAPPRPQASEASREAEKQIGLDQEKKLCGPEDGLLTEPPFYVFYVFHV